MDVAIEVRDLVVVRGHKEVLHGIGTSVATGGVTGMLGPSGSGKTTLMRAIVGVQIVESGSVTVLGQRAGTPKLRRRVAYVTQAPSDYADLTFEENLCYFARIGAVHQPQVRRLVATPPRPRTMGRRLRA